MYYKGNGLALSGANAPALPKGEVDANVASRRRGQACCPQRCIFAESGTANAAPFTTLPVKMRLERSAEFVGAKPLHLLTQTALPLKSPTGAFIATLRSANAVAPNVKFRIIIPLIMRRAKAERIFKPSQLYTPTSSATSSPSSSVHGPVGASGAQKAASRPGTRRCPRHSAAGTAGSRQ